MKRDDDLIRELLIEIEAHDDAYFICTNDKGSGDEERLRHYHLVLLTDAGMLEQRGKFGSTFSAHSSFDIRSRAKLASIADTNLNHGHAAMGIPFVNTA